MSHRPVILLRGAALLAQLLLLGACSSSDGGGGAPAGGPGNRSNGPSSAGAAALMSGAEVARTDDNCTSTNAKSGATCMVDCTIPCGFQRLGTKVCSCVGGVYATCPCPAPAGWRGAAAAPYCDVAVPANTAGLASALKNAPCDTEWTECVGRDPVSGNTPQGCACLANPSSGKLQWYCGSTNKWFSLPP